MVQSRSVRVRPSRKALWHRSFLTISVIAAASFAETAHAQERDPMLFHDANGFKVRGTCNSV